MKKSVLLFAVGAMLFATACDTKKAEIEEVTEETTENTEEAMEAAAEESNQFADNP